MKKVTKARSASQRGPRSTPADPDVRAPLPDVRERPHPLFGPPPLIVETVFFSRVGHTFRKIVDPFGPTLYAVQDFLLDQTGTSGADGAMSATKVFDLTTAISYRFNVWPKDRSKRVKVVPPATGPLHFSLDVGRRFVNAASDTCDLYVPTTYFIGLNGPAPVFSYATFCIGHATNHWIQFRLMADVLAAYEFNGFSTLGVYPPRSFDPGTKSYVPFASSVPFNLPSSNGVPHLMFAYTTPDPVDPGPFVSLV